MLPFGRILYTSTYLILGRLPRKPEPLRMADAEQNCHFSVHFFGASHGSCMTRPDSTRPDPTRLDPTRPAKTTKVSQLSFPPPAPVALVDTN